MKKGSDSLPEKQAITFTLVETKTIEWKICLPDDWRFTSSPTTEQVRWWISSYARDVSEQSTYHVVRDTTPEKTMSLAKNTQTTPFQLALALAIFGVAHPQEVEDINSLQQGFDCPVFDDRGTPLKKGGIYLHRGDRVRVEGWQFGCGNVLDAYYWVYLLEAGTLENRRITVEATYNQHLRCRAYHAPLSPCE